MKKSNNISRLLSKLAAKYPELLPLFRQDKVKQNKVDKDFKEAWIKIGENYNKK